MSEEEKQAIETMHTIVEFGGDNLLCGEHRKRLQIVLNLIDKQEKTIKEYKKDMKDLIETNHNWLDDSVAKGKVIDKMTDYIFKELNEKAYSHTHTNTVVTYTKEEIKKYFYKEIEEDDK